MDTYYPVGDGSVQFADFGCQQIVTQDGLAIDSGVALTLVEQNILKVGAKRKGTQDANQPSLEGASIDGVPVQPYNPLDALANNAPGLPDVVEETAAQAQTAEVTANPQTTVPARGPQED